MASGESIDAVVLREVALALAPLGRLSSASRLTRFIRALGWELPGQDLLDLDVSVFTELPGLVDALASAESAIDKLGAAVALFARIEQAVEKIVALANRADAVFGAFPAFLTQSGFKDEAPRRLLDYVLATYLATRSPAAHATLALLGFVESVDQAADPATFHSQTTFRRFRWERFPELFKDPGKFARDVYGWGTPAFDSRTFLERASLALNAFGVPSGLYPVAPATAAMLGTANEQEVRVPLYMDGEWPETYAELGLALAHAQGAGPDHGLAILPYALGTAAVAVPFGNGWELKLEASISLDAGIALVLLAGAGFELRSGFLAGPGHAADGQVTVTLHPAPPPAGTVRDEIVIFGQAGSTRLAVGDIAASVGGKLSGGNGELVLHFALTGAKVVVSKDSFGQLLAFVPIEQPLEIGFDLDVLWSSVSGLKLSGGAGLALTLQLGLSLFDVIFVDSVDIAIKIGTDLTLQAAVATNLRLEIGPVVAVVAGLGLKLGLAVPQDHSGNLGVIDLRPGFKPPTGVGLSIDTPTVKAGGFLSIDVDRGRYVGALELAILGKFDLSAIAIITTKRPDGSDGFSLLFLISMTLPVPIPLGYNFYFAGAGGLLGLNRSVDLDYLREGIRTGTADSILFPTDVVRRIDAIVRDLEGSFPQAEGQFLVGPMAMITWSNPPLITVKLGLIIEIGSPVRIAILGVLRAALPDASQPILDLKVAFLGAIDIQAGLLSFDASIYDSFIGVGSFKLYLEGDIALRVAWGQHPDFVTSVGGFHPSYQPAAHLHLPAMRRLSLSLLKDNPRLSLSLYFAVTTNTVQCGSRLDFYFKVSSFSVVGEFGFDVLFQFSPFHIDAHVWAGLAVKSGDSEILSLRLDFRLLGPNPWIARGTASFKVLFFKVSVEFEKRFGDDATQTLPDVEVVPLVLDELGRDGSWRGELGPAASTLVTLRPLPPVVGQVVIDAAGRLTVGQRVLPLDTDFSLFGTSRPIDAMRIRIKAVRIGGTDESFASISDDFAPAAFRAMSDQDKLKAAAYEPRPSGAQITSGQAFVADEVVARPVAYEQIVSDAPARADAVAVTRARAAGATMSRARVASVDADTFGRLVAGGAAGRSSFARANARRAEVGKVLGVSAPRDRYAVTSLRDLRPLDADGRVAIPLGSDAAGRPTYAAGVLLARSDAEQRRSALLAQGVDDDLEIIPEAQLAA